MASPNAITADAKTAPRAEATGIGAQATAPSRSLARRAAWLAAPWLAAALLAYAAGVRSSAPSDDTDLHAARALPAAAQVEHIEPSQPVLVPVGIETRTASVGIPSS